MAELTIRIKKKPDGSAALSCERADGSVTWQRQEGVHGRFFPLHDLTHYAVETTLGHRRGFYGLVAEGWNMTDFGAPWPRGRLPADTNPSELIVGFLDAERASGARWPSSEFAVNMMLAAGMEPGAAPPVTDEQLSRIRSLRAELFARWDALPPGETLELTFDRAPANS